MKTVTLREIPQAHEDDVKGYHLLLTVKLIPVVMNNSHRTGMEIRIMTVELEGKIELPILRMELHLIQSDSSALPRHSTDSDCCAAASQGSRCCDKAWTVLVE